MPYNYRDWANNHVWLHKQPLFLWQMALSLKIVGINEVAVRLPSALLGTLFLWPVYRLGRLAASPSVGYYLAVLFAFAYYQLELTTGWQSVDHADVVFGVYVGASLWAYAEHRHSKAWAWAAAVGVFAGSALLCKWLPGLVVYAVWAGDALLNPVRRQWAEGRRWLCALALTALVALPWQVYTHYRFPRESAFETQYAAQHFTHVLEGHDQPWHFYFGHNLWYQYHWVIVLAGAGLVVLGWRRVPDGRRRPLLWSGALLFVFFSVAATKMPSYTYVVAPCMLFLAAVAWAEGVAWLRLTTGRAAPLLEGVALLVVVAVDLRPTALLQHHTQRFASPAASQKREAKAQWAAAYRALDRTVPVGYVVVNVPSHGASEAMFYSRRPVYVDWPSAAEYRFLRQQGLHVAAFAPRQKPQPDYLRKEDILLLPDPTQLTPLLVKMK
ncbi:ArnT family glycosyltransferase [Hymenobacter canadensis]|uniref:Glycosyltransferase family 39 protein n=1 Tax=Hymenobacter canadensis TaxID=2999067 RepID=A0ABY7LXK3_9BACT|nr:glycosyltransferase family 39 protein [Hymenobacter canadensis]WBA44005.1 glycosyltransferase family 39 protein [Hymenobacter canadensis]